MFTNKPKSCWGRGRDRSLFSSSSSVLGISSFRQVQRFCGGVRRAGEKNGVNGKGVVLGAQADVIRVLDRDYMESP